MSGTGKSERPTSWEDLRSIIEAKFEDSEASKLLPAPTPDRESVHDEQEERKCEGAMLKMVYQFDEESKMATRSSPVVTPVGISVPIPFPTGPCPPNILRSDLQFQYWQTNLLYDEQLQTGRKQLMLLTVRFLYTRSIP